MKFLLAISNFWMVGKSTPPPSASFMVAEPAMAAGIRRPVRGTATTRLLPRSLLGRVLVVNLCDPATRIP